MTNHPPSPLVSVLVPTKNRPQKLRRCLQGLARQSFQDFEVILVNDGGSSVATLLSEFAGLRVNLIELDHSEGLVKALNHGLSLAGGSLIAECDDDDLLLPHHLALLVSSLGSHHLVYSDSVLSVLDWRVLPPLELKRELFAYDFSLELLQTTNFVPRPARLYPKVLHEQLGLYDPELSHHDDWDWLLRVANFGSVRRVPEVSVEICVDLSGDNLSQPNSERRLSLDRLIQKHGLPPLPETDFYRMLLARGEKAN